MSTSTFNRATGSAVESVNVKAENQPATFDPSAPGGLTINYGSDANIVLSMLHGITPEETHGFLGFLGGVGGGGWAGAAGMLPFGGFLGALIGAVLGTIIGEHVSTKTSGVQMSPVVQVARA